MPHGNGVSATMKSNHRNVAVFYALIYAITYLLFSYGPYRAVSGSGTIPDRILSASIGMFLTLPVIYTLRQGSQSGHMLSSIGFRRKGILTSFIWANAFLLPIMLILLGMLLVAGPCIPVGHISSSPSPPPIPVWYPFVRVRRVVDWRNRILPYSPGVPIRKSDGPSENTRFH